MRERLVLDTPPHHTLEQLLNPRFDGRREQLNVNVAVNERQHVGRCIRLGTADILVVSTNTPDAIASRTGDTS